MTISSLLAWIGLASSLLAMLAGTAGVGVKLLWSSTTLPGCFFGMCPYGKLPLTEVTLFGFLNWRRSLKAAKPLPLPSCCSRPPRN